MCLLRYPAIRHSPSQRPAKWGLLKLAVMVRFDSETIWHRAPPGGEECVVSQSPNFMFFCRAWGQEQGRWLRQSAACHESLRMWVKLLQPSKGQVRWQGLVVPGMGRWGQLDF